MKPIYVPKEIADLAVKTAGLIEKPGISPFGFISGIQIEKLGKGGWVRHGFRLGFGENIYLDNLKYFGESQQYNMARLAQSGGDRAIGYICYFGKTTHFIISGHQKWFEVGDSNRRDLGSLRYAILLAHLTGYYLNKLGTDLGITGTENDVSPLIKIGENLEYLCEALMPGFDLRENEPEKKLIDLLQLDLIPITYGECIPVISEKNEKEVIIEMQNPKLVD